MAGINQSTFWTRGLQWFAIGLNGLQNSLTRHVHMLHDLLDAPHGVALIIGVVLESELADSGVS